MRQLEELEDVAIDGEQKRNWICATSSSYKALGQILQTVTGSGNAACWVGPRENWIETPMEFW